MSPATIKTHVGHAEHGDNIFCGESVRTTLAGQTGWAGLISLAVGSRLLSADDAAVLEDAAVCTLAADPRIWPLKVTRLVSSYGGTLAGFCAGHLLLEEAIMGPWPTGMAAAFLVEVASALGDGIEDDEATRQFVLAQLASGRKLSGFGVPFRPKDERVAALEECLVRRERANGKFWKLSKRLDAIMTAEKKVHGNQSLALAAVFLDLGFDPSHVSVLTTALLDLCFYANAVEEARLQSPSLRCVPAVYVEYVGREPRVSPRAEAKRALDSQAPVLAQTVYR